MSSLKLGLGVWNSGLWDASMLLSPSSFTETVRVLDEEGRDFSKFNL